MSPCVDRNHDGITRAPCDTSSEAVALGEVGSSWRMTYRTILGENGNNTESQCGEKRVLEGNHGGRVTCDKGDEKWWKRQLG